LMPEDRTEALLRGAARKAREALATPDPEARTAALMRAAMEGAKAIFPPNTGIVILAYPFNGPPGQRVNYIGNGNRADVAVAMKEVIARWEGRAHDAPPGKQ